MWTLQKIRLFITALLVTFPMTSFSQGANPENEPIYQTARETLHELLNDQIIQHTFSKVQSNLLRTNLDLLTGNFFASQPLIVAMTPLFKAEMLKEVRAGALDGTIKMTLLERGANYFHNDVLDVAQAAIRASGRSEAQVQNAKIYITDGPMNAYTISGQEGEQIIVIDTGLFDKLIYYEQYTTEGGQVLTRARLKKEEAQPVLEHENAHQLFGHIDIGLELSAMVRILYKHFVYQGQEDDVDDIGDLSMLPDHHYSPNASRFSAAYREAHTKAVNFAEKTITEVASRQEGLMNQLIHDFVEHQIEVALQDGEMSPETMKFLVSLRTASPNSIAKEEFVAKEGEEIKLIGRNEETSADQGAHNGSKRAMIEPMFAKFNGAMQMTNPLDRKPYIAELLQGNQALIDANIRLYQATTQEEREDLLGTNGGDHPTNPDRAENIRRYGRTLDAEAMQNPILRLLVLHGGLGRMENEAAQSMDAIKREIAKLESAKKLFPQGQKILANLKKMLVEQISLQVASQQRADIVLAKLIGLVKEVGFSGNSFSSNHALTDILDFTLASKIRTLITLNKIDTKIQSAPSLEKEILQKLKAQYQIQLFVSDTTLRALRSAIHKSTQQSNIFTPKINQVLDREITVARARAIRRGIAKALNEEDNWDRHWFYVEIGKEDRDIKGASVKDDQAEMQKALATRQRLLNKINNESKPIFNPLSTSTLTFTASPFLTPFLEGCRLKIKGVTRVSKNP
jgi:hypothetical protein